jgi:hypothetical protein
LGWCSVGDNVGTMQAVPTWIKWCAVRDSNPPHRIKSPALCPMS